MATNGYCTVAEFRSWADVNTATVSDALIDRAIDAVSRGIDNFTKRQFWQAAGTRVFDSCDGYELDIDDAVSVSQVATDTAFDGTYATVWTATDFQLLPLNPTAAPEREPYTTIRAVGSLRFPRPTSVSSRVGLVRVTGVWGWQEVPAPVRQAALILVHRTVKRRGSPEGVAGFDEFGQIRISSRDDPDAVRYLLPYQKVEFGVA